MRSSLNAGKLLANKAIEIDMTDGPKPLANMLYLGSIYNIKAIVMNTKLAINIEQKTFIRNRLEDYMKRVLQIEKFILHKDRILQCIQSINIREGETGYSYENIFGKYLTKEVNVIHLDEPFLEKCHQVKIQ